MHRKITVLVVLLLASCFEPPGGGGDDYQSVYISVSNCTNDSVGMTAVYAHGSETHYTQANTSGRSNFQYYFSSKESYDNAIGKIKFKYPFVFNGDTLDQEKDFNFSCRDSYRMVMVYGDINNCIDKSELLDTSYCKAFKPLK